MWIAFHQLNPARAKFVGALGRALVLAQNFEENCKFVYMTAALEKKLKDGEFGSLEESFPFAEALHRLMLGRTLIEFQALGILRSEHTATLGAAKDARNYIAHESALIVLGGGSEARFRQGRRAFETRVRALAAGDALVSRWSYMIQEKQPPPSHWASRYPDAVARWVVTGSRRSPLIEIEKQASTISRSP